MAIPVKLPVFEGPLDLLMHLIEKNKIDIYDIPIVEITDQYLEYVHQMDHEDMDVTSEFLVMAATLLDIKSRMLLPREKDEETGEEEADPREELVRRLLEYKMYKYMSEELAVCQEQAGVRYFRVQNLPKEVRSYQPPIDYEDLLKDTDIRKLEKVFGEVLRRKKSRRDPIRSGFGKIRREEVNIDTKTLYIRAYLQAHPQTDFRALLESQESKEEVIVTFLILLELMKVQKVHIVQDSICGKILIESTGPDDLPPVTPTDKPADPEETFAEEAGEDSEDNPAEEITEEPNEASTEEAIEESEDDSAEETGDYQLAPSLLEKSLADGPLFDDSALEDLLMEETLEELAEEEQAAIDQIPAEPDEDIPSDDEEPIPVETPDEPSEDEEPVSEKEVTAEDVSGTMSLSIHNRIEVVSPLMSFRPEVYSPIGEPFYIDKIKKTESETIPEKAETALSYESIPCVSTSAEEETVLTAEPAAEKILPAEDETPTENAAIAEEFAESAEPAAEEVLPVEVEAPVEEILLVEEDVLAEIEEPEAESLQAAESAPTAETLSVEEGTLEEEPVQSEESAPAPFSAHLWCGRLPKHVSPRFTFKNGSVQNVRTGGWAYSRRFFHDQPVWEQARLSRLWTRHL